MAVHGRNTDIRVDNPSGTLTDISQYADSVDFPSDISMGETTGYKAPGFARTYLPGLNGRSITIGGKWDAALDANLGVIANNGGVLNAGGSISFQFGPAGSTSGNVRYTGECFLQNYRVNDPLDGVVTYSAQLMITGQATRDTYP